MSTLPIQFGTRFFLLALECKSMKSTGLATDWREVDRFDGGVGWLAYPEEEIQRASHGLVADGEVWLVDPVDADGIDAMLAEYGTVAGVVLLLGRHERDCAKFANRHGVSVWVPDFLSGVESEIDAPVERFRYELGDSGYVAHNLVDHRFWQEALLYNEDTGVLVVADAVGTAEYFRTNDEVLGVHPFLRLTPPKVLARLEPSRILVGHGPGIHENAPVALKTAVEGARRGMPRLLLQTLKRTVFGN